jgi:DNA primase
MVSTIKQAVDIVGLVRDFGFTLQRAGSKYKILCPFHPDHRPSLELNPERQSFKCWACGAGGDIFDFVQRIERVEFPEAVRMLAERAGIALEQVPESIQEAKGPTKADLRLACSWALSQFQDALESSNIAHNYLSGRSIQADSVERFQLGFSPDERDWLMRRAADEGFELSWLEAAGLIARNDEGTLTRDRFRGRVIFPICDWQGNVIAFGGRILPEVEARATDRDVRLAKYINSPETPLFQKRRQVYGVDLAREESRRAGWVAVVEGYTDVIAAHQAGVSNVVGTLGTALGEEHVSLLKRLAERVVLVFDGDAAGQKAAERALEIFMAHEVDVRVLVLPSGLDPCDFFLQQGAGAFLELVEASVDPLRFTLDRAASRFELGSTEGTRLAVEWVLSYLSRVPQNQRGGLDLKMAKALDLVAQRLRLPVDELRRRLRDLRSRPHAKPEMQPDAEQASPESSPALPVSHQDVDPLEAELVRIVLNDPALVANLKEFVAPDSFSQPQLRTLLSACYELHAEGMVAGFDEVATRVGDVERSLAAGLLLPVDPQPFSKWVTASPWADRLEGALRQWNERNWRQRVQSLERQLAEIDRENAPEEYESARRAYLMLHHQRPDTRKTPSS